jgi:hypothetical protein
MLNLKVDNNHYHPAKYTVPGAAATYWEVLLSYTIAYAKVYNTEY